MTDSGHGSFQVVCGFEYALGYLDDTEKIHHPTIKKGISH